MFDNNIAHSISSADAIAILQNEIRPNALIGCSNNIEYANRVYAYIDIMIEMISHFTEIDSCGFDEISDPYYLIDVAIGNFGIPADINSAIKEFVNLTIGMHEERSKDMNARIQKNDAFDPADIEYDMNFGFND